MQFRSVQKRTQIRPKIFLFDFSLHHNRGMLKFLKYVLKFFKTLVEKDFFPHFDTLLSDNIITH
jgi:hypothetical protein